jgi:phosphoserine aminotransferase
MYNFYPGPSKVYPMVKDFAKEAFENGILEKNHRSEPFMQLLEDCIKLFKNHLNIPSDYKVFFVSSATEAWEICAQSLFGNAPVKFYYSGAFGEKWMKYAERIHGDISEGKFDVNQKILPDTTFPGDVCLVANETSNGTQFNPVNFKNTMSENSLLYVDAVSSLGGVDYEISDADVWISSSQKCFGLPSGMGIMIVSPKALARAKEQGDRKFYNSLLFIEENFDKLQTPYTPNILSVYLLKRLLENLPNIKELSQNLKFRANRLYEYFDSTVSLKPLVLNNEVRSQTLVAIKCSDLKELQAYLAKKDITIGKGYGKWKDTTFRIANFPAIDNQEYDYLLEILSNFVSK